MRVGTRKQNGRASRGGTEQRMPVILKPGSRGRTANSRPAWRTEQDHNKVRQGYKEDTKTGIQERLVTAPAVMCSCPKLCLRQ